MYVAAEGTYILKGRKRAWIAGHPERDPNNSKESKIIRRDIQIWDVKELEKLLTALKVLRAQKHEIRLVTIDTLAACNTGRDENATALMTQFADACKRICNEIGCAVLLIHHSNKGGETERGNGSLRAASDMMSLVTMDKNEIIKLECVKNRLKKFEPLCFALEETEGSAYPVLTETPNKETGGFGSLRQADRDKLEAIRISGQSSLALKDCKELFKTTESQVRTLQRWLEKMKEDGHLIGEGSGVHTRYNLPTQPQLDNNSDPFNDSDK